MLSNFNKKQSKAVFTTKKIWLYPFFFNDYSGNAIQVGSILCLVTKKLLFCRDKSVPININLYHTTRFMQLLYRLLLPILLPILLIPGFATAQDCAKNIKENKKISGVQIANTSQLAVVVRGGYTYFIEFFANEKGVFAKFVSQGGIEFNQDDQVVFVDASGKEKAYKFTGMDELMPGAVPTHRNNLRLDLEAMQWLSASNVIGINFINFVDRQKFKFTINADRQSEFKSLATCFYNILEKDPWLILPVQP